MIRFPNPGSDISGYIRIFQVLFQELSSREFFDLDDISRTLVVNNLVTSSGSMGQRALERSTRADRSRDPLYNQSKMYSEIFKLLGWIHPAGSRALDLQFTHFGAHVSQAASDARGIFSESILGIVYPNSILAVKGNYQLRPFAAILRTFLELDGILCRDEMIVGPLCLEDDRDPNLFYSMIATLRSARGMYPQLISLLKSVSEARNIKLNTMHNYTRFPLGVIRWLGWAENVRTKKLYGRSMVALEMTDEGYKAAETLLDLIDIRFSDIEPFSPEIQEDVIVSGYYQLLRRAGFDISPLEAELSRMARIIGDCTPLGPDLLFSPFQELSPSHLKSIFPRSSVLKYPTNGNAEEGRSAMPSDPDKSVKDAPTYVYSIVDLKENDEEHPPELADPVLNQIKDYFREFGLIQDAIMKHIKDVQQMNQSDFYPLVAALFGIIGYDCELSRPGVNYQRWDAMIIDDIQSIPIEIKSPGEEMHLSVKSIRQAVENKVILISRKPYPTTAETTSLVVGYLLPNQRSEVNELIDDVYVAYGFRIGVIDLESLLRLSYSEVFGKKRHDRAQLRSLRGFINVPNPQ